MSTRLVAELQCPSWGDHLEAGPARAEPIRRTEGEPSGHRRAGLAPVGDVQDIAGVLDVLDRRR